MLAYSSFKRIWQFTLGMFSMRRKLFAEMIFLRCIQVLLKIVSSFWRDLHLMRLIENLYTLNIGLSIGFALFLSILCRNKYHSRHKHNNIWIICIVFCLYLTDCNIIKLEIYWRIIKIPMNDDNIDFSSMQRKF